jgi:hypothetical protein
LTVNQRRRETGFSLLEVMGATALAGIVTLGAYSVLTNEVAMDRTSAVQALVGTEFSRGLQLANNPARLLPYLNTQSMGACLSGMEGGSGCLSFGAWQSFPVTSAPNQPQFQANVDLLGPCQPPKPCLVKRNMRFQWVCTAKNCQSLLIEVSVTPDPATHAKERLTQITIDRRMLRDRGQIAFSCDSNAQSVEGVDYLTLTDICTALGPSNCANPMELFTVDGAPADCKPALDSSCGTGYATIGLDASSESCIN